MPAEQWHFISKIKYHIIIVNNMLILIIILSHITDGVNHMCVAKAQSDSCLKMQTLYFHSLIIGYKRTLRYI